MYLINIVTVMTDINKITCHLRYLIMIVISNISNYFKHRI